MGRLSTSTVSAKMVANELRVPLVVSNLVNYITMTVKAHQECSAD